MALFITDQCVNCDVCEPVCPNGAIYAGKKLYHITPAKCTECVGHFVLPQCVEVCPVECIFSDPEHPENTAQLQAKFVALTASF
jgi:ferredoxin